ncbi:MAG: PQQ-dependent sugar dehydrogenase [Gemmatirosa sp.]
MPVLRAPLPGAHRSVRPLALLAGVLVAAACGGDSSQTRAGGADTSAARDTGAAGSAGAGEVAGAPAVKPACAPDNGGITLPAGFCATVFFDSVGGARHVAVAPNGDVFVALQTAGRRGADESGQTPSGTIVALRDTNGDGRADTHERFGDRGGSGIALAPGWVYADQGATIVRYPVAAGQLRPSGPAETIVQGLPMGGHAAHSIVLDGSGTLFVNVGSLTNSCQQKDRGNQSPGVDPCTELETRAGVWRYRADQQNQRFSAAERYATGIRNAVAMTLAPDGQLWVAQHGRDQLFQNWGDKFTADQSAELPAEELFPVRQGEDFGWPYCYFDPTQAKRVLAPEYGGDGRQVGRCAEKRPPVATFPAHWAPMSVLFYTGRQLPARYRDGAFIAFHGSWNRAPRPQGGYQVVFQPMRDGRAEGKFETFADGFAGGEARRQPGQALYRPVGLATAPDGGIYVTDDARGRIWKIVYTGTN